jgi:hypothetical protein
MLSLKQSAVVRFHHPQPIYGFCNGSFKVFDKFGKLTEPSKVPAWKAEATVDKTIVHKSEAYIFRHFIGTF